LDWAYGFGGGTVLKLLEGHIKAPNLLKNLIPTVDCGDPIGSLTEGKAYGGNCGSLEIPQNTEPTPALIWALTRASDVKIFEYLKDCANPQTWMWVFDELHDQGRSYNPSTGNPFLHTTILSPKLSSKSLIMILKHLFESFVNPFAKNRQGKRAIDLAAGNLEVSQLLLDYQQWKPEKAVRKWFGPYCYARQFTVLLVLNRLEVKCDQKLRHYLLNQIAQNEYY
jgi:hypothetical protein